MNQNIACMEEGLTRPKNCFLGQADEQIQKEHTCSLLGPLLDCPMRCNMNQQWTWKSSKGVATAKKLVHLALPTVLGALHYEPHFCQTSKIQTGQFTPLPCRFDLPNKGVVGPIIPSVSAASNLKHHWLFEKILCRKNTILGESLYPKNTKGKDT